MSELGAGEPQYQIVPALIDCILRTFDKLRTKPTCDSDKPILYLIRSDGMGKQKNIALRVMETIAGIYPDRLTHIEHHSDIGRTEGRLHAHDGGYHRIVLVVCVVVLTYIAFE